MTQSFNYTIYKSKRARNISIRIEHDGDVKVSIPYRASEREGHNFVNEKRDWITKHVSQIKANQVEYAFEDGEKIPYLGGEVTLKIINVDLVNPKATVISEYIEIQAHSSDSKDKTRLKKVITKRLKENFRELIHEAVEEYNKHYSFEYNRIAIKDNETNWGSCSSKKNLNFNWRLIFAPLDIIDYVVVHELCHLKEQNHSKRFWDLVAQKFPDYKEKKKWLRQNGALLKI